MAKATKETKNIEVVKVLKQDFVTIELSMEEALALRIALGKIGGCPKTSIRKYLESVYNSLEQLFRNVSYKKYNDSTEIGNSTIYFKDNTDILISKGTEEI